MKYLTLALLLTFVTPSYATPEADQQLLKFALFLSADINAHSIMFNKCSGYEKYNDIYISKYCRVFRNRDYMDSYMNFLTNTYAKLDADEDEARGVEKRRITVERKKAYTLKKKQQTRIANYAMIYQHVVYPLYATGVVLKHACDHNKCVPDPKIIAKVDAGAQPEYAIKKPSITTYPIYQRLLKLIKE